MGSYGTVAIKKIAHRIRPFSFNWLCQWENSLKCLFFCCIIPRNRKNKKFWKELICLLSLHYLKMSFALKPVFAPT
jgi:hypothetical protein